MQQMAPLILLLVFIQLVCGHLILHVDDEDHDCDNKKLQKVEADLAEIKGNVADLRTKIETKGSVLSQCPAGWQHHGESCYLLHYQDKYDWFGSQMICAGHNAHLAHVENAAENTFIKELIKQHLRGKDAHVWLGAMDDVVEGQFLWYGTDLPVNYTDWYPGEPNSVRLNLREDCLVYWADYNWQWADFSCPQQCYFICEKE